MGKRNWTNIQLLDAEIIALRDSGKTRQEIADTLGLTKVQIKNWGNRHNKAWAREVAGLPAKRRSEMEYQHEIKRLKMENELLRDFLRLAGRT